MGKILTAILLCASACVAQAGGIDPDDILGHARADVPFSKQRGFAGQFLGRHPRISEIPDEGIHGSPLPSGETMRFGRVADPEDPKKSALLFQVAPWDPPTSGSRRAELRFPNNIELGRVYWIAFGLYVYDWGRARRGDEGIFGTQVHSGDDRRGLWPSFALGTYGDRFRVGAQHSLDRDPYPRNSKSVKTREFDIPFGRWTDFVFRFRESLGEDGFVQVWMDGKEIHHYRGPLGFDTPQHRNYAKFGYYNWSQFDTPRKMLLRSPVLVSDPGGNKYRPEDLRAFVASH